MSSKVTRTIYSLHEALDDVHAAGFAVYGGVDEREVAADGASPLPWRVALMRIGRAD